MGECHWFKLENSIAPCLAAPWARFWGEALRRLGEKSPGGGANRPLRGEHKAVVAPNFSN